MCFHTSGLPITPGHFSLHRAGGINILKPDITGPRVHTRTGGLTFSAETSPRASVRRNAGLFQRLTPSPHRFANPAVFYTNVWLPMAPGYIARSWQRHRNRRARR